jgi:hypothetical protein
MNPELVKTMVLGEPPIAEFLARSHLKDDVELLQEFRTSVERPTQDASKRGAFEKAAQTFMDGVMEMENFFHQLPDEGKQPLMDNAKPSKLNCNLQCRHPLPMKMLNR